MPRIVRIPLAREYKLMPVLQPIYPSALHRIWLLFLFIQLMQGLICKLGVVVEYSS